MTCGFMVVAIRVFRRGAGYGLRSQQEAAVGHGAYMERASSACSAGAAAAAHGRPQDSYLLPIWRHTGRKYCRLRTQKGSIGGLYPPLAEGPSDASRHDATCCRPRL